MKIKILSFVALASPALAAIRGEKRRTQGLPPLPTEPGSEISQSGVAGKGKSYKSPKSAKAPKKSATFMNPGYEYLTGLLADQECLTEDVYLTPPVCSAVGGYPLSAFYGASESTQVACCPRGDVDLSDVAENCVETSTSPGACTVLAPEGVAILLSMNVTWCCHEPAGYAM